MSVGWFGRALAFAAGIHVVAAAQTASSDRPAVAAGIRTDHAVGFYDASRRRVVIVGGAGDPKDGDRDQVWSWSGRGGMPMRTSDRQAASTPGPLTTPASERRRRGGIGKPADGA